MNSWGSVEGVNSKVRIKRVLLRIDLVRRRLSACVYLLGGVVLFECELKT